MRLDGRTALVTGAARGLGRSISSVLAREGAHVVMADVDDEVVRQAATTIPNARAIHMDLRDRTAVSSTIETVTKASGLDILVNNAGFQRVAPIAEFEEDDWIGIVETMLTGTFLCTKHALPHLRRSSAGRVINIASVHGLVASPCKSAYVAAKHGIVGFTKSLALEEAGNGVTANAVCPGYIRTDLVESQVSALAKSNNVSAVAALEDILLQPVPMKRLLEPEEVAELVAYIASDTASGITGSAIPIDGGWTAQ